MRLLVLTQAVDVNEPVLGFFNGWLKEFAKHFEKISVVCLKEGTYHFPENVKVHSLGKEQGASRGAYVLNFYRYAWRLRREYDVVFVHMNQEYVLLGWFLWKLLGKRVYLWRNHYAGGVFTNIAVALSDGVFCTSKFSYTAKFKKTKLMPVGVDTNVFKQTRVPVRNSILFLARIAQSKRVEVLIDALALLKKKGITIPTDIYGDALPKDAAYRDGLFVRVKELGLASDVHFHAGVLNTETPAIYASHEIFVNCSTSGMYDKTIFEAAASGALVLAASRDYASLAGAQFSFSDSKELAGRIEKILALPASEKEQLRARLRGLVDKEHSLAVLAEQLSAELQRSL